MTTLRPDPKAVSPKPETQQVTSQPEAGLVRLQPTSNQGFNLRHKLSIQTLVATSFVVQIVAAVGLTGWFSLRNGEQAVSDLSTQLRSEITARVQQRLNHYLSDPHLINEINIDSVRLGELDFQDITRLERHFWQQLQLFPSTSYIYAGTEQNVFSGAEQTPDGFPNVASWTGADAYGGFETFTTDEKGYRRERLSVVEDYDLLTRPWYVAAKAARKPIWGEISILAAPYPNVTLPAISPIYDAAGTLQGVFAVDLSLLALGDFLQTLEVGKTGQIFIMERDGLLVSTSTPDPPFNDQQQRLLATQSQSPLIQGTAQFLNQTFGDLSLIERPQSLRFKQDGERQLVQITPYQDEFGLDWLIVVAVPEADFMAQINANTHNMIVLCSVALIIATLLGTLTSRWITAPIGRLSRASQAIANGRLDQMVEVNGVGELKVLAHSFNQMAQQLRQSFMRLVERVLDAIADALKMAPIIGDTDEACYFFERVLRLYQVVVITMPILTTMRAFAEFRTSIGPTSGFQSFQFRHLEIMSGAPKYWAGGTSDGHGNPHIAETAFNHRYGADIEGWLKQHRHHSLTAYYEVLVNRASGASRQDQITALLDHPQAAPLLQQMKTYDQRQSHFHRVHLGLAIQQLKIVGADVGTGGTSFQDYLAKYDRELAPLFPDLDQ